MTHKAIGELRVKPLSLEGFAADFNAAMARTGATVRGLADELGINKSAISRVRTGKQVTQSNFIELFNWLSALDRSPTVVEEEGASVYTVYDWAWTDETGDEHYARTPERAARLQAEGQNLTPVYTRAAAPPSPSKPEQAPSPVPQAVAALRDAVISAIERMYVPTSKPTYGDMIEAVTGAFDASLVSPPKAGAGEPVAWLCYGGADGRSGKQFVTRGIIDGHVIRPSVDTPLYANHEARGDGVRVTDDMVEAAVRVIHDAWQRPPAGRTWDETSSLYPQTAEDLRTEARAALEAALRTLEGKRT